MTIPLVKESDEFISDSDDMIENCVFCDIETRFWHENTNNPVCPDCSKKHRVAELFDHGQLVREEKRKMKII